ncbi:GDP-mannose 4,6-dehydratase [Cytobacillus spongiae]|uniref:GDP-mannose 4,6-dehydratase n=1 Tax=Cytobacillus spongiae TaxID=2901381 RepID=UPI001F3E6CF7|nr:GDP-mannose 4,6-dehydratase [Cytobacillus spongiae]UII57000.1 GDP-mannose 4,6-dehydratase [Cytobacillus spongiae]
MMMDKAIVIGNYEFIGFHLCRTLLNKGYEVSGIYNNQLEYVEEMQFEFGRNANYTDYYASGEIEDHLTNDNQTVIFVNYYDYFHQRKEKVFSRIMLNYQLEETSAKIVLVLPINLLSNGFEEARKEQLFRSATAQMVYLPTIYGPWQSSQSLFHNALLMQNNGEDRELKWNDREYNQDAIYVDDAINQVITLAKTNSPREVILKSSLSHHWDKCAKLLKIPQQIEQKQRLFNLNKANQIIHVPFSCTPSEGLERQRQQIERTYLHR